MQKLPEGKKRNANMELLRLVAMLMVTMLHALGKSGSLQPMNGSLPLNGWIAWGLETLSICAVNAFMLLSGYFMIHSKFRMKRLAELVLQTLFYSLVPLGIYICLGLLPKEELTIYHLLQYCLPIHMEVFWFITAYVVLYMLSPLICAGVNALEEKQLRTVILCLLVYECVFKSFVPVKLVTDTNGYQFLWYLVMFLVGAYFRRFGCKVLTTSASGWLTYFAGCVLIYVESFVVYWINGKTGRLNDLLMFSYHYNQILVVLASIGLFTAFLHAKSIEGKVAKLICTVSPYALGVYLLQENLQLRFTWQGWFGLNSDSLAGSVPEFLLHVFLAVICMFVLGIVVDAVRAWIFQLCRITRRNPIQRILMWFVGFLVLLLLSAPSFAASQENGSNHLTVGVPADRCPVFYLDKETDEIVGIGVDLMRQAAKEAGFQVTFRALKEENLKDALDNSAYDIVMPFGSAISSTSGQTTIVSDNLFQTPFTLVTINHRNLPSLNELHVGMLHSLAGGAETVRELYPGIVITFYETMDECVKALRAGKVDALLHNSYVWSYVLQKPSYSGLSVQPGTVFSMDFRAGMLDTPEGREVVERLNDGISRLTDTRRQAIILDYTARRLYQYDLLDYLYEYGLVIFLSILLVILLVVIFILRGRTHRFEQEEKMRYMMDHDPLTGALSLNGFRKRVEELLRAHPDTPYVLAYNNIRNFKYINSSLGMEAGDELLRFWAEKSMENLPDIDAFGRIEADHFAALCHLGEDDRLVLDEKMVFGPVSNYFIDRNKGIRVQLCTGIYALSMADHQSINVDHMLDCARVAEKRLRDSHKEGFEFYNPDQWRTGQLVADVASHLPVAIRNGEIQVWYQPQVHYGTGKRTGAEALSRWKHSKRGWLSPVEFIPALEDAGLIYDLDCYVWEQVCKDLQRWNQQGVRQSISVNLSRADIMKDQNIPEHFVELTKKYDVSPDQIRVEITETAYVENPEVLISVTQKFRTYGFQVEMDDFGSGYSSLNMLKEVQVNRIKLDLHFLTETGDSEKGRIIIRHMIQMAQDLGIHLIAEGVEKEKQAQFLKSLGCYEMQGYFFYKPMTAEQFEQLN